MRALIVDDHPLYLDAIRQHLIRAFPDPDVQTFTSIEQARSALSSEAADILLLDYSLPGVTGTDGLAEILPLAGSTPVMVMSGVAPAREVLACIAEGARGFLPKTLEGQILTHAVSLVLSGGTYVPIEFMAELAASPRAEEPPTRSLNSFSPRERHLLASIASGATNKEIARDLGLQEVTVKFHLSRLFRRLGVKNRSQGAVAALRMGISAEEASS